jgi:hypothetical protein
VWKSQCQHINFERENFPVPNNGCKWEGDIIFWPSPNFTDRECVQDSHGFICEWASRGLSCTKPIQRDQNHSRTRTPLSILPSQPRISPAAASTASRRPAAAIIIAARRTPAPRRRPLPARFPRKRRHPAPPFAPPRNPSGSPDSPPSRTNHPRPQEGFCGPPGSLYVARMSLIIGPSVWPRGRPG